MDDALILFIVLFFLLNVVTPIDMIGMQFHSLNECQGFMHFTYECEPIVVHDGINPASHFAHLDNRDVSDIVFNYPVQISGHRCRVTEPRGVLVCRTHQELVEEFGMCRNHALMYKRIRRVTRS